MASFRKGTKKETGEGASESRSITSYFSSILSFGNGSSVDESSTREQRTSPQRVHRPDKDLYRSWEDLSGEMDPNKKATITSQPKGDLTSPTHRCETQQLLQVQQRIVALEGAVQEQGRELSEVKGQQKSKKGFKLWKQASKDRDEETAKEIQDKDAQISFYRKKLDNAENLETQNLQLATELSEKESKVEELNQQLTTLTQQMSTVLTENEKLKKLANVTDHHAQIQHWKAEVIRLQKQLTSSCDVEVIHTDHDCSDSQTPAMKVASLQGKIVDMQDELYKATSQALSLKTDLDKAVSHSKSQSREIFDLKKEINSLKLEGREQCKSSSQHPEESEITVAQIKERCDRLQKELNDLKVKYDDEVKQKELLDAQLDETSQCLKTSCTQLKRDYETLKGENARLQKSVVDLSRICEENSELHKVITELQQSIKQKQDELEASTAQALTYKSDFEAERRDREAAHSKLAELEKDLAKKEGHFRLERATYEQHFGQCEKEKGASQRRMELKVQSLETSLEHCNSDLVKEKQESEKLREELKAKMNQVKQYKKENDRQKAQLDNAVESMLKLGDYMQKKPKTKKKDEVTKKAKVSTSSLPDPSLSAESRLAAVEKLCDRYQTENQQLLLQKEQLEDDAKQMSRVITELQKYVRENLHGTTAHHHDKTQDQVNLLAIEADPPTAGLGELHRDIPNQLLEPTDEPFQNPPPTSAPLRARDPETERRKPPQTIPLRARASLSPTPEKEKVVLPISPDTEGLRPKKLTSAPLRARDPESERRKPPQTFPLEGDVVLSPAHVKEVILHTSPAAEGLHSRQVGSPQSVCTPIEAHGNILRNNPQSQPCSSNQEERFISLKPAAQTLGSSQHHEYRATTAPGRYAGPECGGGSHDYDRAQSHSSDHHQASSMRNDSGYNQNRHTSENSQPQSGAHCDFQHRVSPSLPDQQPKLLLSSDQQSHQVVPEQETAKASVNSELQLQQGPLHYGPQPVGGIGGTTKDTLSDNEGDPDIRFRNVLQDKVDDDIQRQASEVIQQVGGGQRHKIMTDRRRPYDPNLVCPMCMKRFRIGEIQKFKHHVNTCDGTDDPII